MTSAAQDAEGLERHRRRMTAGLAAAIREKGLADTQVTDVVRHAGASRRTFYRSFADKDACFLALAEHLYGLAADTVLAAIDTSADWETQLDQGVGAFLGVLAADPVLVSAFKLELPRLGARGLEIQRASADRYAELLVRLTSTDAMRAAGVGPVAPEVATMLMAGLDGLVVRAVGRGEPVGRLEPVIKTVFRRVLAPGAQAGPDRSPSG